MNHGPGHFTENGVIFRLSVLQKGDDLGNVLCLIADSLHICYHLKCCGNFTKISTNWLLFQKKLHAQSLNIMLFVVNLLLNSSNLLCGSLTDLHACQKLTGLHDGLTAQISHFQDLI